MVIGCGYACVLPLFLSFPSSIILPTSSAGSNTPNNEKTHLLLVHTTKGKSGKHFFSFNMFKFMIMSLVCQHIVTVGHHLIKEVRLMWLGLWSLIDLTLPDWQRKSLQAPDSPEPTGGGVKRGGGEGQPPHSIKSTQITWETDCLTVSSGTEVCVYHTVPSSCLRQF